METTRDRENSRLKSLLARAVDILRPMYETKATREFIEDARTALGQDRWGMPVERKMPEEVEAIEPEIAP